MKNCHTILLIFFFLILGTLMVVINFFIMSDKRVRPLIFCGISLWLLVMFFLLSSQTSMDQAVVEYREIRETQPKYQQVCRSFKDNGQFVRDVIVTSWSSGAKEFAKFFSTATGCYQHFSPLIEYEWKRNELNNADALDRLTKLLQCDYNEMESFLESGKKEILLHLYYGRQRELCIKYQNYCWQPKFLAGICKMFPFQSMIIYRLRLSAIQQLLSNSRLFKQNVCPGNVFCDDINSIKFHDCIDSMVLLSRNLNFIKKENRASQNNSVSRGYNNYE